MHPHTVSARNFTRDVSAAKRAAADGPVFITDRGKPAFALMRIEDYHRLTQHGGQSLLQAMDAIPGGDFEFSAPKLDIALQWHADDA